MEKMTSKTIIKTLKISKPVLFTIQRILFLRYTKNSKRNFQKLRRMNLSE